MKNIFVIFSLIYNKRNRKYVSCFERKGKKTKTSEMLQMRENLLGKEEKNMPDEKVQF